MKIWTHEDENLRGWWAAAGRIRKWKFERPLWLSRKDKNFTIGIGVAGLMVDWNIGVYVSAGIAKVGFVGVGWSRGYGTRKQRWARHDKFKAKVLP